MICVRVLVHLMRLTWHVFTCVHCKSVVMYTLRGQKQYQNGDVICESLALASPSAYSFVSRRSSSARQTAGLSREQKTQNMMKYTSLSPHRQANAQAKHIAVEA